MDDYVVSAIVPTLAGGRELTKAVMSSVVCDFNVDVGECLSVRTIRGGGARMLKTTSQASRSSICSRPRTCPRTIYRRYASAGMQFARAIALERRRGRRRMEVDFDDGTQLP